MADINNDRGGQAPRAFWCLFSQRIELLVPGGSSSEMG